MSSPSWSWSSGMVSGINVRMTLWCVPARSTINPFSRATARTRAVSLSAGSLVPRSRTSSIPAIAPTTRTSPTMSCSAFQLCMRSSITEPIRAARSGSFSSRITSITATPEAALDLVRDQQDPVAGGELAQPAQEVGRGRDESALAQDRLDDHGGDPLWRDLGVEQALERGEGFLGVPASILVRKGRLVDLGRVRAEVLLVGAD